MSMKGGGAGVRDVGYQVSVARLAKHEVGIFTAVLYKRI